MKCRVQRVVSIAVAAACLGLASVTAASSAYSDAGAKAYEQVKDWQGMLQYGIAWTRAEPNNPDGWASIAVAYTFGFNRPDLAVAPLQRSTELNPIAPAWHALGDTYLMLRRWKDAEDADQHAVRLNPNKPKYWHDLAIAYYWQGKRDQAEAACDHEPPLLEKQNDIAGWNNLGNAYAYMMALPKAVQAYQQALKINPNYGIAWNNLGLALEAEGNVQGALQAFNRAATLGDRWANSDAADLRVKITMHGSHGNRDINWVNAEQYHEKINLQNGLDAYTGIPKTQETER